MVVDGMEYARELARVNGVDLLLARELALVAIGRHLSTELSKSGSMSMPKEDLHPSSSWPG